MRRPAALGTLLRLLIARTDDEVQAFYEELGLPFRPRFYPIFDQLRRNGPTNVTDLARAASVSQPAATQTLAELKRLGLVTIAAGADRRERLARLTAEGAALAARLEPAWRAIGRAADALDPDLAPSLERALAALDRRPFGEQIRMEMRDD